MWLKCGRTALVEVSTDAAFGYSLQPQQAEGDEHQQLPRVHAVGAFDGGRAERWPPLHLRQLRG